MIADSLLSELERQQKYLNKLPPHFAFPLFNARTALESQRKSGYRNTAAAAREIVDNSIEAGADQIHIVFETDRGTSKQKRGKRLVTAIAFIDNGSGMLPEMARYALTWGGGTHFDEPGFIGRFGFGLPNASINQTRYVDVYTRTTASESFTKVWLNLDEFSEYGLQTIEEPVEAELPNFVQRYIEQTGFNLDHGTVVVWNQPDRLTYKTPAPLKDHLVDDFGVTYRYFVSESGRALNLIVEGVKVEPMDPLFLMPEGRYYLPESQGGAQCAEERFLPVRYYLNLETGERHLKLLDSASELEEIGRDLLALGTIHIRVARFPIGFVAAKSEPRALPDSKRRFEIRKSRRGMSFVRANREIETVDVFPKSESDRASGLGSWPLLQGYAYHWAVEAKFEPELDEVFGITNDKQGVRPIEDFWRVLAQAEIDDVLRREQTWQTDQREKVKPQATPSDSPSPAELAAQDADLAIGKRPRIPAHHLPEAKEGLDAEAQHRATTTGNSKEGALSALEEEAKRRPYRIDYYDSEDGPFYKPAWIGRQQVVFINRSHPFYQIFYSELLNLPGGALAKEAVDVLLLTLGKAELTAEEQITRDWYVAQRKQVWNPYIEVAMRSLGHQLRRAEEEIVEEVDPTVEQMAFDVA